MRSGVSAPIALADTGHGFQAFLRRQAGRAAGIGLFAAVAFALASLGTWNVADPSFSHATDAPVTNAMGYPGAVFSDLAMQFFGLSSVAALVPAVIWGFFFATARGVDNLPRRAAAWFGAALLFAAIAGCATPPATWPLPSGLGGVFGDMMLKIPAVFTGGGYPTGFLATLLAILLVGPALYLFAYGAGLSARKNGFAVLAPAKPKQKVEEEAPSTTMRTTTAASWRLAPSPTGGCRHGPSCAAPPPNTAVTTSSRSTSATARAAGAAPPSASNRPSAPKPASAPTAAPASSPNSSPRWFRTAP